MGTQAGATNISPPINSKIVWEFGPNEYTHSRGVRFTWYDGYLKAHFDRETWNLVKESEEYNHPAPEVLDNRPFSDYGCVIVGEEGKLFFNRFKKYLGGKSDQRYRWLYLAGQVNSACQK